MTVLDTEVLLGEVSVGAVYASALRGDPCLVVDVDRAGAPGLLPTMSWLGDADDADEALLALCQGATVDVGCGPGRMAHALARTGRPVLGIDIVPEAVRLSQGRGVTALLRDVFHPIPGEGRWESALLADGNIGIGGDPVALLQRLRELVAPTGRVVVDLSPPGTGVRTHHLRLQTRIGSTCVFPWTLVGTDAIGAVSAAASLRLGSLHRFGDRYAAVLERNR